MNKCLHWSVDLHASSVFSLVSIFLSVLLFSVAPPDDGHDYVTAIIIIIISLMALGNHCRNVHFNKPSLRYHYHQLV